MTGTKLSARVLTTVVLAKVAVVLLVVVVGAGHVDPANYTPFVPEPVPTGAGGSGSTVLQVFTGGSASSFDVLGIFMAAA